MLSGILLLLLTSAIVVIITLIVVLSHNVDKWVRASFVTFCFPLLLWQITIFIADTSRDNLLLWNNLVFLWPTIAVAGCFAFVSLISGVGERAFFSNLKGKLITTSVILLTAIQLLSIASNRLFDQVTFDSAINEFVFDRGVLYPIYIISLLIVLAIAIVRLLISYHKSNHYSKERRALGTVLATIGLSAMYGITTNVVVPVVTGSQKFISLGLLTVDIVVVGFALSIIRYRFLEVRSYVYRAIGYIVTFVFMAIIYLATVGALVTTLLEAPLTVRDILLMMVTALVLAATFHPLHKRFNKLTQKFFFRDYYDPQVVLDSLGRVLVGTASVNEIKRKTGPILTGALNPSFVEFTLAKDHQNSNLLKALLYSGLDIVSEQNVGQGGEMVSVLKQYDIVLAVKMRTSTESLGFILVGPRKSGTTYSSTDIRFLSLVADQFSIAIQNALRFEEIQKFNETLQDRVEEATTDLKRANDKLKKLDQTKDDFISMASHQLRTPLTSVKGYVSMVLDGDGGKLSPMQRKLLNQSFVSAQRMVYLISDLLNVSRLKTGKFVLETKESNLAQVIEEEISQLVETAKARNLELIYRKPQNFPLLMLDETKLRQVIMNFADNAIYYTPNGGKIEIKLLDKPDSVDMTVKDTGIGVPRHEQHNLFSKFYRAENAKNARPDGTGLGLFMAKKVILAQGGEVIFHSQEGKGSTFGFTFPKRRLQGVAAAANKGE